MLQINRLTAADISGALHLSTQAGWNQLEQDWARIIALGSGVGGRVDGRLVATATLMPYAPAMAWVGMVLVDPACRGQGFGAQIMDAVLALADTLGITTLGLDATDAGRPLYLKRGFVDAMPICRRVLSAEAVIPIYGTAALLVPDDWAGVLQLDRAILGIDRSQLLSRLREESICQVARDNGRLTGFAFRRAGRLTDQIGPVVAGNVDHAQSLIRSLAATSSARGVLIDTFPGSGMDTWFEAMNFRVSRNLLRMIRGDNPLIRMSNPSVFAGAGLELG